MSKTVSNTSSTGATVPSSSSSSSSSALPVLLKRPDSRDIAIDPKWTNTPEGWPTESIRAGSLSGLVTFYCYYTSRRLRPHLVPPNVRCPIDSDYCDTFLNSLSSLGSINSIADEFLTLLLKARERNDTGSILQIIDGYSNLLNASKDHLLYLRTDERLILLTMGNYIYSTVNRNESSTGEGTATVPSSLHPLVQEALTTLQERILLCNQLIDTLTSIFKGSRHPTLLGYQEIAAGLGLRPITYPISPVAHPSLKNAVALASSSSSSLLSSPTTVDHLFSSSSSTEQAKHESMVKNFKSLWECDPSVIAEHWTLLDHKAFASIPIPEFLACGWDKPRYEHSADMIREYIDRFNALALWISAEILVQGSDYGRAAMIVRFIQIASHFRRLNNFCGISAICMALKRESVSRLESSWQYIPKEAMKVLNDLMIMIQDKEQYRRYKEALKTVTTGPNADATPCVPHLGAHTMEWTAAEMNLPETTELFKNGPSVINFKRYRTLWTMINPIIVLQTRSFLATKIIPVPNPLLLEVLLGIIRPFHFRWEADRETAVNRLEIRSHEIEPLPDENNGGTENSTNNANDNLQPSRKGFSLF